jgi:hypothetical protein
MLPVYHCMFKIQIILVALCFRGGDETLFNYFTNKPVLNHQSPVFVQQVNQQLMHNPLASHHKLD